MTTTEPTAAEAIADDATPATTPIEWPEVVRRFSAAPQIWISTVAADGRPSARPVLCVWVDGALHFTVGPGTRKARNLAATGRCVASVTTEGMDLVIEGTARRVTDEAHLRGVGEAYGDRHGWPVTVVDGAFEATYGAPSAGPPPYQPHVLVPERAYAFGTDEDLAPRTTRFTF